MLFFNCKNLQVIHIPSSLFYIGKNCFKGCKTLFNLCQTQCLDNVNDTWLFYDKQTIHQQKIIGTLPYWLCTVLSKLGVQCDGSMFDRFDSLQYQQLNKQLCDDHGRIFKCEIPTCCSCIDESTFSGFKSLQEVIFNISFKSLPSAIFAQCFNLKQITLPTSIEILQQGCFNKCLQLTFIDIPLSVTTIGSNCFKDCHLLQDITFHSNLKYIGENCFESCHSLKSIVIPDSLIQLPNNCFKNCTSLTSLTFSSTFQSFTNNTFDNCMHIQNVSINNCAKCSFHVPYWMSLLLNKNNIHCQNIKFTKRDRIQWERDHPKDLNRKGYLINIIIPSSITMIADRCFHNCGPLTKITIPTTVTLLENHCFIGCNKLRLQNGYNQYYF